MNIPLLLSISPDSSEVMDLEVRVCWTRAGWLHVTAVIPSPRHEVWPFISVCLSLKDTLICSVQSRRLRLSCTLPYHTPRGFITLSVWPQGILLHFAFVLCPVLSEQEVWTFSEQSGPEPLYAEEICKMAPRRKSETCARLSVSAVGNNLRLRSVSGPALTSGKHASMHECTQGD